MERVKRKKSKQKITDEITGTLFTSIPIIGLVVFTFIPLIMAVIMSFMDMPGMNFDGAEFYEFGDLIRIE